MSWWWVLALVFAALFLGTVMFVVICGCMISSNHTNGDMMRK